MSRVVTPLLETELLEWDGRGSLKIPQRFEESLHEVFVRSGGEETLEKARVEFQKERVRFKKESEENQEQLARIAEEIWEIGRKSQLTFMEIDFDRLYELEKERGYLLAGGRR